MNKEKEKKLYRAIEKMSNFGVGDKVVCINSNWWCEEGRVTTVIATPPPFKGKTEDFWVEEKEGGAFPYGVCQMKEDFRLYYE